MTQTMTDLRTGAVVDPSAYGALVEGEYVVKYSADDAANNGPIECQFRLRVVDTDPPVLDCSKITSPIIDGVVATETGKNYWLGTFDDALAFTDNVKVVRRELKTYPANINAEGFQFGIGFHSLLYTAWDQVGAIPLVCVNHTFIVVFAFKHSITHQFLHSFTYQGSRSASRSLFFEMQD
jgi:hypothetical protein